MEDPLKESEANVSAENIVVEEVEVEPTKEDIKALTRTQEPRWKTKKRLRDSPRKRVEKLFKDIDHTVCGPPCQEGSIPPEILDLNKEYQDLFTEKIPKGLPKPRDTDHVSI